MSALIVRCAARLFQARLGSAFCQIEAIESGQQHARPAVSPRAISSTGSLILIENIGARGSPAR